MGADPFAEWRIPVTIRPRLAAGGMGTTYGPPVVVPAVVELTNRLVITADKREVVSTLTASLDRLWLDLQPGSLVEVDGVEREALTVTHDRAGSDRDLAELEGTVIAL